jgi:hypothetical protein
MEMEAFSHLEQLDASWVTATQWASEKPFEVLRVIKGPEDTKKAQKRREVLRRIQKSPGGSRLNQPRRR